MNLDEFTQGEIPKDALAELQSHFDEADIRFETPRILEHGLGCDILVDVEWYEHDSDRPGHEVRHTVVFLHRPATKLPEFEIRPRTGIPEKALGLLASMLGMPSLELEDEPEFSDRYSVMTTNADSVRVLLGRESIDSILGVDDLFFKFSGRGVLVSRLSVDGSSGRRSSTGVTGTGRMSGGRRRDHGLDDAASRSLLEDALVAAGPIVDDPEVGRRAADAVEGTYAEEAIRNITEKGGFVGRQMAKMLITGDMLDELRTASTPRRDIPRQVARKAWGGTTMPLAIAPAFGFCFAGMGIFMIIGGQTEGLIFAGVGLLALLISAFILRHRMIRKNLITNGIAVDGRITGVERTNTTVNEDPISKVTIETRDGGEPVVVKMGSQPATQARRMMESNPDTWILRDPRKPARGLWLQGWAIELGLD